MRKKNEQVKVDMDFLMKMANQVDALTAEIKNLKENKVQEKIVPGLPMPEISKLDYSITINSNDPNLIVNKRIEFLGKFVELLKSFNVSKFKSDYVK